jgi:hypothetical protein
MSDDNRSSDPTPIDDLIGCDVCAWTGDVSETVLVHTKPAVLNLHRACAARAIVQGWAVLEAEVSK